MRTLCLAAFAALLCSGCMVKDDDPDIVVPGRSTTIIEKDSPAKTNIEIHTPPSSTTTGGTTGDTQPGTGTVTTG